MRYRRQQVKNARECVSITAVPQSDAKGGGGRAEEVLNTGKDSSSILHFLGIITNTRNASLLRHKYGYCLLRGVPFSLCRLCTVVAMPRLLNHLARDCSDRRISLQRSRHPLGMGEGGNDIQTTMIITLL